MLIFSSCQKNDLKETEKAFELESFDGVLASVLPAEDCYTFIYPISFNMPDGSTITLDGDDDSDIKDWYDANFDSEQRPSLIYPVEVLYDSNLIPVNDDDTMRGIKERCAEKWEYKRDCFEFIYPISFRIPDGSVLSLQDADDSALKDWYEANPNEDQRPGYIFPIDVMYKEEIKTLATDTDLERLKDACEDYHAERPEICFNFVFPITVVIENDVITGSDMEDLRQGVKDWYDANPNNDAKPAFVYPLEIIFADGMILQVDNEEELEEAKEDC